MPILVLPPRYTQDSIDLRKAAEAAGWPVERLPGWRVPDRLKDRDVALYGEPLFAAVVADHLGLALLEPPFDWLPRLPERYRQRNVKLLSLAEAREIGEPIFAKPADDKCFRAGVYESGRCLPQGDLLPPSTPVLIAEPVHWQVEFRCFVLEGAVVAISPYLRDGELARSEDGAWEDSRTERAQAFAQEVLEDRSIRMPPGVVLDVGLIEDRGWAVVEANAAWGSGLYGCDPAEALRVVERACRRAERVQAVDREWLLQRPFG